MNDKSILTTLKSMLGVPEEVSSFDEELIAAINNAFSNLKQLGVGPANTSFVIESQTETWGEFNTTDNLYSSVKTYIYLKTRLQFDPPSNSFLVEAINNQIRELEFRLNAEGEGSFDA